MHVRTARPSDAPAMGALVVRAWQAAYRELMPDDYLDGLTVDDRADLWTRVLTGELDPPRAVFVAADHDGRIVGFVAVGGEMDVADATRGQVYALNVDPDRWGHGVGRRCWASPLRWARSTRRCQCEIFSVAGLVEVSCS